MVRRHRQTIPSKRPKWSFITLFARGEHRLPIGDQTGSRFSGSWSESRRHPKEKFGGLAGQGLVILGHHQRAEARYRHQILDNEILAQF
jgi:hypothetical protein